MRIFSGALPFACHIWGISGGAYIPPECFSIFIIILFGCFLGIRRASNKHHNFCFFVTKIGSEDFFTRLGDFCVIVLRNNYQTTGVWTHGSDRN